jgi:hypothetical protein
MVTISLTLAQKKVGELLCREEMRNTFSTWGKSVNGTTANDNFLSAQYKHLCDGIQCFWRKKFIFFYGFAHHMLLFHILRAQRKREKKIL